MLSVVIASGINEVSLINLNMSDLITLKIKTTKLEQSDKILSSHCCSLCIVARKGWLFDCEDTQVMRIDCERRYLERPLDEVPIAFH